MQEWSERYVRRLYEVSRDRYAPALATFAAGWLDDLAGQPRGVALCLGRDGIAPFVAAQTLLRAAPRRFRGVHPRRVTLAYVSRPLAQAAATDAAQARLLDRYLHRRGVSGRHPLTVVDVGIHGSIQDCLQRLYPDRPVRGHYLVLRRRHADPNGAAKRGFLADLDVAPPAPLGLAPSWPPPPGWEVGGTLRTGEVCFLRPRSIHVLEDLWNGVGGSAAGLREEGRGGRVVVVRPRDTPELSLGAPPLPPRTRARLKRAALRGIADGVARACRGGAPPDDVPGAVRELAAWFRDLEQPAPLDAHLLDLLVRRRAGQSADEWEG
ncbi:hypothetical protein [Deinococcus planocerae]|uniref:hypothetical protein n=1 Tax=Deinococcus planocerae TaxID=1737569 RepID=UPI000C7EAA98|nr:hypothetical protein [Deinococcus planocerae]